LLLDFSGRLGLVEGQKSSDAMKKLFYKMRHDALSRIRVVDNSRRSNFFTAALPLRMAGISISNLPAEATPRFWKLAMLSAEGSV
jgi:hypothetical protein